MADPAGILPQHGTWAVAVVSSVNWLFELYWPGDRFIARLKDGRVLALPPGEQVEDWLVLSAEPEKPPSMVGRFFGQRPRKPRRIED